MLCEQFYICSVRLIYSRHWAFDRTIPNTKNRKIDCFNIFNIFRTSIQLQAIGDTLNFFPTKVYYGKNRILQCNHLNKNYEDNIRILIGTV